jgi:hypothetical protein
MFLPENISLKPQFSKPQAQHISCCPLFWLLFPQPKVEVQMLILAAITKLNSS